MLQFLTNHSALFQSSYAINDSKLRQVEIVRMS